MSLYDKLKQVPGLKQLLPDQVRFPSASKIFFGFSRASDSDIAAKVGDGTSADVLMSPVRWLQRSMREAPLQVVDEAGEPLDGTRLEELLRRPNPEYGITTLTDGAALSMSLDGNAYWVVARNDTGEPVELWYAPHTNMEPKWPSDRADVFISHYEYTVAGEVQILDPEDVLHFREGVDLDNIRKGLSPLKGLLREVFTDNEAAEFAAALLRNNGVPGLVISPADNETTITPEEAEAAKAKIETETTGINRGRPIVMTGATKVDQFGFSPRELDLSPLRNISEERVTAALGVAAAVVGFGSGLQQTKVGATMDALIRLSWQNGVIPLQRNIADELTLSLAPAFGAGGVVFDNNGVEALRENEDTKASRLGKLYIDGVITRAEARGPLGFESEAADEVFRISFTDALVPQGQAAAGLVPSSQVSATGSRTATAVVETNGNGKGHASPELLAVLEHAHGVGLLPDYIVTPAGIMATKQHQHSPVEMAILENAVDAPTNERTRAAADRLDAIKREASSSFVDPLIEVFERLGKDAGRAAAIVLARDAGELRAALEDLELKQNLPGDVALTQQIMALTDTDAAQEAYKTTLEQGYLLVANEVTGAISDTLGVDFVLSDAAQQEVLKSGGLRAGLVDLTEQTKESIFDALALGREEGLTADNLARFIRDEVEAGPWRDAATRAKVIARTEGANAANLSSLEVARNMEETLHVQIFDNRTGFDDAICTEANGKIVTIDEAEAMGLAHPNCTRSFVPVNSLLLEELVQ